MFENGRKKHRFFLWLWGHFWAKKLGVIEKYIVWKIEIYMDAKKQKRKFDTFSSLYRWNIFRKVFVRFPPNEFEHVQSVRRKKTRKKCTSSSKKGFTVERRRVLPKNEHVQWYFFCTSNSDLVAVFQNFTDFGWFSLPLRSLFWRAKIWNFKTLQTRSATKVIASIFLRVYMSKGQLFQK